MLEKKDVCNKRNEGKHPSALWSWSKWADDRVLAQSGERERVRLWFGFCFPIPTTNNSTCTNGPAE